ncbi:cytochrome c/FTR1 family iron permease [Noviherbaspirillum aerium]|uniref:cytochrome c/FTR1 family iron permease n=1 Tax=Noviherbaspirillum aerium TaxID=2588497 RepID=UPI00124E9B53|nr:cytochrome c/FTR1 family iron permease [Noviherbaspirillum aerium]
MNAPRRLFALAFFFFFTQLACAQTSGQATEDKARQIWQLLDYMAVDYGGAVADGNITNADEYAEMQEFAQVALRQLAELPDKPERKALLQRATALKSLVANKAAPADVGMHARGLAQALLASYPVPMAPATIPGLRQGAALYQAQCASCHGAEGRGDGPLAARLDPPPIAFTDRERARERSLFSLYQTISRGVEGTSMPAFASLTDEERWAMAFYISTLAYQDKERAAGAQLWQADPSLKTAIPTLKALTQASESELAKSLQAEKAAALLAHLRSHPEVFDQTGGGIDGSVALAKKRLQESLAALENSDRANATRLALSAYLDGFEPVEPALAVKNGDLLAAIEKNMGAYRAAVSAGDPVQARSANAQLQAQLDQVQAALKTASDDPAGIFLGALTILLREGIEALLVVVAMIAFLKKADRRDMLPIVHAGWAAALAGGGLTWFAATYLVEISGASRELTEGFSAIFAAVVLLCVGIWMHGKSAAGRWQAYIRDKLSTAMTRQSGLMLFLLSFITVYREVFETVLFYAAMWSEGNGAYLLSGFATGVAVLAVITWVMLRTSSRLPIGKFFAVSSALVALLSFVLIGKGVAALQEAGVLDVYPVAAPSIDLLGIYPTLQSLLAQLAVVLVIAASMIFNARANRLRRQAI